MFMAKTPEILGSILAVPSRSLGWPCLGVTHVRRLTLASKILIKTINLASAFRFTKPATLRATAATFCRAQPLMIARPIENAFPLNTAGVPVLLFMMLEIDFSPVIVQGLYFDQVGILYYDAVVDQVMCFQYLLYLLA